MNNLSKNPVGWTEKAGGQSLEERVGNVERAVSMAGIVGKEVLTFDEAATFTGLSKSTLYKLTAGQRIPHYKPSGKLCYFNRSELQEWLQRGRVSTTDEVQQQAADYCMKNKKGGRK
jgi:excisionase family DNA binding protein